MALTDYTKNILNIEDKNIYFYDEFKWKVKYTSKNSNGQISPSIIKLDFNQ